LDISIDFNSIDYIFNKKKYETKWLNNIYTISF
jgi:hypothetical protein